MRRFHGLVWSRWLGLRAVKQPVASDGFIIIAVLVVLALLSTFAVASVVVTRSAADSARQFRVDLRHEATKRSAVELIGYQLLVLKRSVQVGPWMEIRLDEGVARWRLSSDAGLVDLNTAPKELLQAAYGAAGCTALAPGVFAARVIDWRDKNDTIVVEGAESDAYRIAGAAHRPRNGPFRVVEDLRYVLGLAEADVVRLRPFVTLFNRSEKLDYRYASQRLIGKLPGMSDAELAAIIALRSAKGGVSQSKIGQVLAGHSKFLGAVPASDYLIEMETVVDGEGASRLFEFVLTVGKSDAQPFRLVEARQTFRSSH